MSKKVIIVGLIVIVGLALIYVFQSPQGSELVGFDKSGADVIEASAYDQVGITASRSQQGVVKTSPGKVVGFEITSDSQSLRYFQLFDMVIATVPSRAASVSGCDVPNCAATYAASTSWASDASLAAKPVGSYEDYASQSLIFSLPIPAATSSSSPTIIRLGPGDIPAISFSRGIIFGISSVFGSYSSASVNTNRHTVKVLYQ